MPNIVSNKLGRTGLTVTNIALGADGVMALTVRNKLNRLHGAVDQRAHLRLSHYTVSIRA